MATPRPTTVTRPAGADRRRPAVVCGGLAPSEARPMEPDGPQVAELVLPSERLTRPFSRRYEGWEPSTAHW